MNLASLWAQLQLVSDIRKTKHANGVSRPTSLLIVVAAIAQLLYNLSLPVKRQFSWALPLQALVTIAAQCWLMNTVVTVEYAQRAQGGAPSGAALRVKRRYGVEDEKALLAGDLSHVWAWDDTASYLLFVLTLFTAGYLLTSYLHTVGWYVEGLGLLAVGADAVAWLPQLLGHARGRLPISITPSTALTFLLCDALQLGYVRLTTGPQALLAAGCIRLAAHAVLVTQVWRVSAVPSAAPAPAYGTASFQNDGSAASSSVQRVDEEGLRSRGWMSAD